MQHQNPTSISYVETRAPGERFTPPTMNELLRCIVDSQPPTLSCLASAFIATRLVRL